ncbi:MAG TPA: TraR/DksA C4-type zinc finger protein [Thermodesulfovibrionales bacterium]|nr:TraR/DksA C4-type zinc finger protein [Thermodesulfovibrionales bacterium]
MATKKPQKAQKKVLRTTRTAKALSPKKKTARTPVKTSTVRKAVKPSVKGKDSGKATAKKPVPASRKKQIKKKSLPAPAAPKRVSAVAPQAKPKKKLTPREQKIQDIKKSLLAQRNTLLSEAEEALNALPGQTIFPDMGDQASAEIDRSFMLRLRGREQRLLKKIEQAIEKIDSGSFGICDICGEEITLKRLEARPVTNMCIFCKTEQEEEEKLRGGA